MLIDLRNMERLKRIFAFFGLVGALLLAACSKQAGDAPGPETGTEPAIRWGLGLGEGKEQAIPGVILPE